MARENHHIQTTTKTGPGRTLALVSLGAVGVASDHVNRIIHLDTLFKILLRRGEHVEQTALALVRRESPVVRPVARPRAISHKM